MTQEEIIRLAREAGFSATWPETVPNFERFAALVAAAERESCAMLAEQLGVHPALNVYAGGPDWYKHGKQIAAKIRERGKQE